MDFGDFVRAYAKKIIAFAISILPPHTNKDSIVDIVRKALKAIYEQWEMVQDKDIKDIYYHALKVLNRHVVKYLSNRYNYKDFVRDYSNKMIAHSVNILPAHTKKATIVRIVSDTWLDINAQWQTVQGKEIKEIYNLSLKVLNQHIIKYLKGTLNDQYNQNLFINDRNRRLNDLPSVITSSVKNNVENDLKNYPPPLYDVYDAYVRNGLIIDAVSQLFGISIDKVEDCLNIIHDCIKRHL